MKKLFALLILLFATSLFVGDADARYILSQARATTSPARGGATPTPTPTIRPSDTFTRADGNLNGTAVEIGGGTWHDYESGTCANQKTYSVLTNKARNSAASGVSPLFTDTGYADSLESVTLSTTGATWGLLFRYAETACDVNDGIVFYTNGGGCVFLQRFLNGQFSGASLGVACPTVSNGMVVAVNYNGTAVSTYVNGSLQFSATSSLSLTSTSAGFFGAADGASRFTNWSIVAPN